MRLAALLAGAAAVLLLATHCVTMMPGRSHRGALPAPTSQEKRIQAALQRHVRKLASAIGERHVRGYGAALQRAAAYVGASFRAQGYEPIAQRFTAGGQQVENLEVQLSGARRPEEIVVVGAHYDSAAGTPGANDNASGVAALLELARIFSGRRIDRTLRFVAFVNEEPPFFHTEQMGSLVYARRCARRKERVVAMISAETIGYYSDKPDSQHYPFPFSLYYPDVGNFVAVVGNVSSRRLVRRIVGSFRRHTRFPCEGAGLPGFIKGAGWSDHWSFWQVGYPAVMVTDTAPFRYPHYHAASDTPDKIDYARTARVVAGLARVLEGLVRAGD